MNNSLVSIIIPVYNVEQFVEKCIRSCFEQSYKNIEIIAVDDGSTDNSLFILNELKKEDSRLMVYSKKNGGVSSARNIGLEICNGEYITFIDADDYFSRDFVEYMVGNLKSYDCDFVISKNCFTEVDQEQILVDKIEVVDKNQACKLLLSQEIEVGCWNKMYKKSIFTKSKLSFDEKQFYGEGLKLTCEYAINCDKICICNKRLYYYRKNNLESATTKFKYKNFQNGELSLLYINSLIKDLNKDVYKTWIEHYSLFCFNAIIGITLDNNDKKLIKVWISKLNKYFWVQLFDLRCSIKIKIKLIIMNVYYPLLSFRTKKRKKQLIERSV